MVLFTVCLLRRHKLLGLHILTHQMILASYLCALKNPQLTVLNHKYNRVFFVFKELQVANNVYVHCSKQRIHTSQMSVGEISGPGPGRRLSPGQSGLQPGPPVSHHHLPGEHSSQRVQTEKRTGRQRRLCWVHTCGSWAETFCRPLASS